MNILVADDDPFSAAIMEKLIASAGHRAILARDGAAAWEVLRAPEAPRIAFLDWMMPEIDGLELCRRIRGLGGADYTYVAILSSRNKQRDISLGYHAGADDFLTKPYKAEDVLARLRVAERLVRTTGGSTLREAIAEARMAAGGDVIVRSGARVGRVIFHRGRVAWAHISDEPGSLAAMLAVDPSIGRDEIQAVIQECSESGRSFVDVLVEWGLIERERLREIMSAWIRDKIASIAALAHPRVIFSPESRASTGNMLFLPSEVIDPALLEAAPTTAPEPASSAAGPLPELDGGPATGCAASLDRAIEIEGALSAAIFDVRSGLCLGSRGQAFDLDVVWSNLRLAALSELWAELEDVLLTTREHIYLLRPFTRDPARMIFLVIDRSMTKLGMVRRALAECTERGAP